MSKLDIIREILHDSFKHPNQRDLEESSFNRAGRAFNVKYRIVKQPQIDMELYRFEQNCLPFFKDVKNLKKMCDYILFAEDRGFLFVFLIELKLGPDSAKKQLDAGKEFVNYIINSSIRIGKEIDPKYKIRKVRICDSYVKKQKLKADHAISFDKQDYCEYSLKSFYLERLMQY